MHGGGEHKLARIHYNEASIRTRDYLLAGHRRLARILEYVTTWLAGIAGLHCNERRRSIDVGHHAPDTRL